MTQHEGKTAKSEAAPPNQPQVQVLSREAGIALDALIDEHVFGYQWFDVGPDDIAPPTCTHRLARPTGDGFYGHIRAERHADGRVTYLGGREYSSLVSHAWRVVDEMHRRNYDFDLAGAQRPNAPGVEWEATFSHPELHPGCAFADTGPLAICRASLAALATLTPEAPDAR